MKIAKLFAACALSASAAFGFGLAVPSMGDAVYENRSRVQELQSRFLFHELELRTQRIDEMASIIARVKPDIHKLIRTEKAERKRDDKQWLHIMKLARFNPYVAKMAKSVVTDEIDEHTYFRTLPVMPKKWKSRLAALEIFEVVKSRDVQTFRKLVDSKD